MLSQRILITKLSQHVTRLAKFYITYSYSNIVYLFKYINIIPTLNILFLLKVFVYTDERTTKPFYIQYGRRPEISPSNLQRFTIIYLSIFFISVRFVITAETIRRRMRSVPGGSATGSGNKTRNDTLGQRPCAYNTRVSVCVLYFGHPEYDSLVTQNSCFELSLSICFNGFSSWSLCVVLCILFHCL